MADTHTNFNDALRAASEAEAKGKVAQPPAEGGPVNAAQAWLDAIAPKPGADPNAQAIAERQQAAKSWFSQFHMGDAAQKSNAIAAAIAAAAAKKP
jgi:hypothetical protein